MMWCIKWFQNEFNFSFLIESLFIHGIHFKMQWWIAEFLSDFELIVLFIGKVCEHWKKKFITKINEILTLIALLIESASYCLNISKFLHCSELSNARSFSSSFVAFVCSYVISLFYSNGTFIKSGEKYRKKRRKMKMNKQLRIQKA